MWYYDEDYDEPWSYEDLFNGLPEYNPNRDLPDDVGAIGYLEYFRYIINVWLVAIPWMPMIALLAGYNVWFNVQFNDFWAEGNIWLVSNTVYLMAQGFLSVLLAFELPIWTVNFKVIRLFSLFSAVMFNL